MPVYKKRVSTRDDRFKNKEIVIWTPGTEDRIPIPDTEVICNSCNQNIYSTDCCALVAGLCTLPLAGITQPLSPKSGCNTPKCKFYNPKETFGWLIYFDKRDVKADRPYDFYCDPCVERNFPNATEVK